jgi:hypothetical protein
MAEVIEQEVCTHMRKVVYCHRRTWGGGEMADAVDLKSTEVTPRGGSSPPRPTRMNSPLGSSEYLVYFLPLVAALRILLVRDRFPQLRPFA